jgi:hypothetical protein
MWSPAPEAALFELGQHDFAAILVVLPLPGLGIGERLRDQAVRTG